MPVTSMVMGVSWEGKADTKVLMRSDEALVSVRNNLLCTILMMRFLQFWQ